MVCHSCIGPVLLQIGYIGRTSRSRAQLSFATKNLITAKSPEYLWNSSLTSIRKMMVDTSADSTKGSASNLLPEKDEDGCYSSGGSKR